MLVAHLMFLFAQTAAAQTGGPSPEYLAYLHQLEAIGELTPIRDSQAQLDWGTVSLWDGPTERGVVQVFTKIPDMHYTERFYFYDGEVYDPAAPFTLVHHGPFHLDDEELPAGPQIQFMEIDVVYTESPDPYLTQGLTHKSEIDRWSFDVQVDGVLVGNMHREFHHPEGGTERYFEHWAFFANFTKPAVEGDVLQVTLSASQPLHTAAWFQQIGTNHTGFTQFDYAVQTGVYP